MRAEDLMNRLQDEPFRPFRIQLSDGSTLDVPQGGIVIVGKSRAVLPSRFEHDDEGQRIAARWGTIAFVHIAQLSNLDERINGNGRRR